MLTTFFVFCVKTRRGAFHFVGYILLLEKFVSWSFQIGYGTHVEGIAVTDTRLPISIEDQNNTFLRFPSLLLFFSLAHDNTHICMYTLSLPDLISVSDTMPYLSIFTLIIDYISIYPSLLSSSQLQLDANLLL